MAHPEHDAALGRLAAARLRAARAEVRLDAHPDAETWAAYVDGGLVADEVAVLEAHLAACGACRQLVTALAPEPAVSVPAVDVADAPGPARVLPFRPRVMWASMAIAAGLLGAVTIWSVTRLQQPQMASTMAERTAHAPAPAPTAGATAQPPVEPMTPSAAPSADALRQAAPLDASVSPRTDELDRAKSELQKKVATGADDAARAEQVLRKLRASEAVAIAQAPKPEAAGGGAAANDRMLMTQSAPAPAAASRAPATPGVHGPAVNTQQQNLQALNAQMQAQAAQVAAAQAQKEREQAAAPVAPAETPRLAAARPQPAPVPRPPPPPPPEPEAVGGLAESVSVPPPAAAPSGARRQGFGEAKRDVSATRGRAEAALADASGAIVFGEPDGRLRWRIAGGSRIESSSDAGATWNTRYTATSRLRAGSAPGIDTAWAVGDGGLVLRFAVPGTWTPVSRPTTAALVGVTASSADAARVTAEDGRAFTTTDGGRSWTPAEGTGVPPR